MTEMEQTDGPAYDPGDLLATCEANAEPHHDESDVNAALANDTDDGKGGAAVPRSDFDSYASPDADAEVAD